MQNETKDEKEELEQLEREKEAARIAVADDGEYHKEDESKAFA